MNDERYVYHYHVQYQQSPGVIQHVDSIALRKSPVLTGEDLTELRKAIAAREGFVDIDRVILCSVSLLFAPADNSNSRN